MKIKAVCERTGLSDRAVRLYIENGLLTPDKSENYSGRRSFDFSEEDVVRLDRIAALRAAGFSIAQIKEIMDAPDHIPFIVSEVTEKQETELRRGKEVLSSLNSLDDSVASFEELADRLSTEETPEPPAEDSRVRLRYLIASFFDGAYRNGVIDGIVRALILVGLVLFGYYVKYGSTDQYMFSAGMWIDALTVVIASALAVASAVLFIREQDEVNIIVKLFLSNMTLAAAVGAMFLIWLVARIILYPERLIPSNVTIYIAELWIGFIGISAVARVILLALHYRKGNDT